MSLNSWLVMISVEAIGVQVFRVSPNYDHGQVHTPSTWLHCDWRLEGVAIIIGRAYKPHRMNWTSTIIPMWQNDCDQFLEVNRPFELRHIQTAEHEEFVAAFSKEHNLKVTRSGTTARFEKIMPA